MAQYRANQQQEIETGPVPLSEEFSSIHPALTEAVMSTASIDPGMNERMHVCLSVCMSTCMYVHLYVR